MNTSGDFDQLSLAGVDFGEDYCQDFGIVPTNLKGDYSMNAYDYSQLGVVPEGLSGDYDQLGIVPEGLNGYHNQMGLVPQGLGHSHYNQMGHSKYSQLGGLMDTFNAMPPMQKAITATVAVFGLAFVARKTGLIKTRLPIIG